MARSGGSATLAHRLGARVRLLRREVNMTQEQLALNANLSPGFIALVEAGSRLPSLGALVAIAAGLHRELLDLLLLDASDPRTALLDALRAREWAAVDRALAQLGRPHR